MFVTMFVTGRMPRSVYLPVLFLLSRQKSTFCPERKNYELDRKMDDTFVMGTTSSITMQSLGKIVQRAPAVGAKMWCLFFCFFLFLFFCFFLSRSESGTPCVRGVHSSNTHCVAVYRPISTRFTAFFSQGIALSETLHSSQIRRHNFR